jgi:Domain of unknown function (DU1801)
MAGNKTKPTESNPRTFLAAIPDPVRRKDCESLLALMKRATKRSPKMWGSAIVGFGTRRYSLAGGKVGEICAVGFSPRKGDISIYGVLGTLGDAPLLANLGKYKAGKGCLYISRLADIDTQVLERAVSLAFKANQ